MEWNPDLQATLVTQNVIQGLIGNLVVTDHCSVFLERIVGYQFFPPAFFQFRATGYMDLFSHKLPAMEGVLLKRPETAGQVTTC